MIDVAISQCRQILAIANLIQEIEQPVTEMLSDFIIHKEMIIYNSNNPNLDTVGSMETDIVKRKNIKMN